MEKTKPKGRPTTERMSYKTYACDMCGWECEVETNHYGTFYNTRCSMCGQWSTWSCLSPCPEHMDLPEEWKAVDISIIPEGEER